MDMRIGSRPAKSLLYQDVVKELYEMIDQNHLQPGDKLPSERELMQEMDVSRNVLREAFHILEERGVIVSRQGKGRYLRERPAGYETARYDSVSRNLERYSMMEAYEVRQALEEKGMELLVRNASEEDIESLEEKYRQLKREFDATGSTRNEFDLHHLYAEKTGSRFLLETFEMVTTAIFDMMYGELTDVRDASSGEWQLESHRQIIEAVRARDSAKAQRLMHDHLQVMIDLLK